MPGIISGSCALIISFGILFQELSENPRRKELLRQIKGCSWLRNGVLSFFPNKYKHLGRDVDNSSLRAYTIRQSKRTFGISLGSPRSHPKSKDTDAHAALSDSGELAQFFSALRRRLMDPV